MPGETKTEKRPLNVGLLAYVCARGWIPRNKSPEKFGFLCALETYVASRMRKLGDGESALPLHYEA